MEQASSLVLVRSNDYLEDLGFITQNAGGNNPYGLPVGFALDNSHSTPWIGLTCAACHTGMLTFKQYRLHIDGGPGLLDFQSFEQAIYNALVATAGSQEKLQRFAMRLKIDNQQIPNLIAQLKARINFFSVRLTANKTDSKYGYGRLDAFGKIFNAIVVEALNIPSNRHIPNAPVSIPMLWDASHQDLVQWNGSAPNSAPGPIGQNATTAMAVYGTVDISNKENQSIYKMGYPSSSNIKNMGYIQQQLYKLQSPIWPEKILGKIDSEWVKAGKKLYQTHCLDCHALIERTDKNRKIEVKIIEQALIGTDPKMAANFSNSISDSGVLYNQKSLFVGGERIKKKEKTINLVMHTTVGTLLHQPLNTITALIQEKANVNSASIDFSRQAYKARPLNGIWATAPYLHNGSVPSLHDLLLPEELRPKQFNVGSREIDPIKIGLDTSLIEGTFTFSTDEVGNSNYGHNYSENFTGLQRKHLLEYLKTL